MHEPIAQEEEEAEKKEERREKRGAWMHAWRERRSQFPVPSSNAHDATTCTHILGVNFCTVSAHLEISTVTKGHFEEVSLLIDSLAEIVEASLNSV